MSLNGKVYLVGAGPGDRGLITVKARDLVSTCDVLVYDNLVNPAFLAETEEECEQIDAGKAPVVIPLSRKRFANCSSRKRNWESSGSSQRR